MRNDDKDLLKLKTTLKGLSIVLNEIIKENNDATSYNFFINYSCQTKQFKFLNEIIDQYYSMRFL